MTTLTGADMLQELFEIIEARRRDLPPRSYTAQLMRSGEDEILKKVGEEAMEVILAAKGQGDARLVEELADLYFHTLVLLSFRGLQLADVEGELRRRHER
jgi:phosphoribosyl-ATP pyrophosphohydrolase